MKKVLVIGSANIDIVYEVERLPLLGETIAGCNIEQFPGGKGLNQAVASARMDVDTYFLGSMGCGINGLNLKAAIANERINLDYLFESKKETGTAIISLCNQDNTIVVIPSANDEVSVDYIKENLSLFTKETIVVLQNEIKQEVNEFIIEYCFLNDITVIYNPAPARKIDEQLLNKVTYFTPNETEASCIFESDNVEEIVKQYPNQVIVTMGKLGIIYYDGSEIIKIKPQPVTVIDTTGAGDTLNGILASRLASNDSLLVALQYAVYGATLSTTKKGAQSGMPTKAMLKNDVLPIS